MRSAGYEPEDFESEFEVWPENHTTFILFQRMENQWNWLAGMGGAVRIGLNLLIVPVLTARMSLSDEEYNDLLDDLQAMEHKALKAMNE